jgi:hypothetical protein
VGCEVRIVESPKSKDVSDWLSAGGTLNELIYRPILQFDEGFVRWRAESGILSFDTDLPGG